MFGNVRKIDKNGQHIVGILCNIKKHTWLDGDTKFLFSCLKIFHLFAAFTRLKRNSKKILEEKFCISAGSCSISCYSCGIFDCSSIPFTSFYFSVFSLVLVSIEKIHQTLEMVLDHFSKYLDVCQKTLRYAAYFQLSSRCWEIWCVFYILL